MCRRFAKAGYYAIAPDLFARLGDASKERDIQALMTNFVPKTADAQVMSDIDHTVAFASGDGGDTDRLGVTGFCWGGRIVWLYAAHNPALDAGVAFYGLITGQTDALIPKSQIHIVTDTKANVVGQTGRL